MHVSAVWGRSWKAASRNRHLNSIAMKQCTGSLFIPADGVFTMRTSIGLSYAAGGGLGTALVPPRPLRLHRILHRLIAPTLPGAFIHSFDHLPTSIG
jgi:hypothetical protein